LASIQLAADSLAQTASASQRSDVEDIVTSAERGAQLTQQLINFTQHGHARQLQPRLELVDLCELTRKLQPLLKRLTRQGVELSLHTHDAPLNVFAAPAELERVLTNLCRNANDAMPHGGRLDIAIHPASISELTGLRAELRSDTSYVELVVADTGSGISDEVRAHLFEPFFTTKEREQGTGLGLFNVYSIVQQCSGHIEVVSEPGCGCLFRIYLPLGDERQAEKHEETPDELETAAGDYS
jgi:signal transduction histidine kinase